MFLTRRRLIIWSLLLLCQLVTPATVFSFQVDPTPTPARESEPVDKDQETSAAKDLAVGAHEFSDDEVKEIMQKAQLDYQKENQLGEPGLIQNDAVIFGILMAILGGVFYTSSSENRACANSINSFRCCCCAIFCRRC